MPFQVPAADSSDRHSHPFDIIRNAIAAVLRDPYGNKGGDAKNRTELKLPES